jgi:hypothetical protein
MGIESTIFARLNDPSITAFVGPRIYPNDANENTSWPYLTYRTTATAPANTMSGTTGVALYVIQIDIWAKNVNQANSLAAAVQARLHQYRGGDIQGSFLEESEYDAFGDETEGDVSHVTLTFNVWGAFTADNPATIAIGSDKQIRLNSLVDNSTGEYQNSATVTGALYDSSQTTDLFDFSLAYVTGSSGQYAGTIPSTTTATLTSGTTYRVKVTANAENQTLELWQTLIAS